MKIFCVKCKQKTDTKNEKKVQMPNGRNAVKGECKKCGTKKTQFIASQKGGMFGPNQKTELPPRMKLQPILKEMKGGESFLNKLINSNKLPELHFRGFDSGFKPYSFAGPFTKLDKRLDKDKKPLPHSKPVNRVDQSAYHHDLGYENMKDQKSRKILDDIMIEDLTGIRKDKNARWQERADALLVEGFMRAKRLLGLGKKKKQKRHI
jgi:hypothetical protein